jgi:endonuclease III related protein
MRGKPQSEEEQIRSYFRVLYEAWGPQHWWPGHSRFEVIVGAYLTQNTAWTNVEKALVSLRAEGLLSLDGIRRVDMPRLEQLIRPAGYFRQKARRLKTFVAFVDEAYRGSLQRMFAAPTARLRQELLALNGVGPETADSILLYAGNHAVFVVDAYARRILERHGVVDEKAEYEEIRRLFERALALAAETPADRDELVRIRGRRGLRPEGVSCDGGTAEIVPSTVADGVHGAGYGAGETPARQPAGRRRYGAFPAHTPSRMSSARRSPLAQVYNEMHGLIVGVGKRFCLKSRAECEECPLRKFLKPVVGR